MTCDLISFIVYVQNQYKPVVNAEKVRLDPALGKQVYNFVQCLSNGAQFLKSNVCPAVV